MTYNDFFVPRSRRRTGPAAESLAPLLDALLPGAPVRIELWDGSTVDADRSACTVRVASPAAVRRLVWSPDELGLSRAFVTGDIDVDGNLFDGIRSLRSVAPRVRTNWRALPQAVDAARRVGALGRPLPPPPEEARPRGRRHSKSRDADVIGHHYDVGNDFYRLVLGPSMTYSCARFPSARMSLEEAQASKHDVVCRKLGLHERSGARLLDVGCGWGSMAIHAATHYGAKVVGVTISREQAEFARQRVEDVGLADRVEIRLQDYREVRGEEFDAISSIGMSEHVGKDQIARYFSGLESLLVPTGRMLNHAISSVGGSKLGRRTFMYRYVFPDGELLDIGDTVAAMQAAGLEVRDVESLREHYALTLRHWVENLEGSWERAVDLVGVRRARVWRLYMAASAVGFEDGALAVHQVLGVKPGSDGLSGMPRGRAELTPA